MQVKTKNLVVGGLVALLVVLLWYRVAYSPATSAASKAKSQAEQTEARAETLRRQLNGDAAKKKEKAEAIPKAQLTTAVPVDDQITDFLRKTDQVAAASGITWQSVTPTAGTETGGISTINVGIAIEGNYGQVMSYVRSMLGASRIMLIDNVAFGAGGTDSAATGGAPTGEVFAGSGAAPKLQVQISGGLFAQPEAAVATSPAGAGATQTQSGSNGAQTGTAPGAGQPTGVQNN